MRLMAGEHRFCSTYLRIRRTVRSAHRKSRTLTKSTVLLPYLSGGRFCATETGAPKDVLKTRFSIKITRTECATKSQHSDGGMKIYNLIVINPTSYIIRHLLVLHYPFTDFVLYVSIGERIYE